VSDEILKVISDKVDKLDTKLDNMITDITEIKITSAKQHEALNYHIKRSDLNEENIEMLRKEFEPIKSHVAAVNGILKFVAICSSVLGVIFGFLKFLKR
jgi:ABC-type Zn uptake system ZnuABC Zn-binding protein ZnuA